MHDLVADGNSVLLVDHDTQILREADWIVEMGPEAGARGGHVIAAGDRSQTIAEDPVSQIGPFLAGRGGADIRAARGAGGAVRRRCNPALHRADPHREAAGGRTFPKGRLTVVTGVSGSGKTTLVLESLVPALQAQITGGAAARARPDARARRASATSSSSTRRPSGMNVRSTVATYANVHDELRKLFARSPAAKERSLKAGDFSYNTGSLRCPGCDGTGVVSLDVQFLPDVDDSLPRLPRLALRPRRAGDPADECATGESASLPELMDMDVNGRRGLLPRR